MDHLLDLHAALKLQWGRDEFTAESNGYYCGALRTYALQWGRDEFTAESCSASGT